MFKCHVCGSAESHTVLVSEVFQIDGKPVLVENIPAKFAHVAAKKFSAGKQQRKFA